MYVRPNGERYSGEDGAFYMAVEHDEGCESSSIVRDEWANMESIKQNARSNTPVAEIMRLQAVGMAQNDVLGGSLFTGRSSQFA